MASLLVAAAVLGFARTFFLAPIFRYELHNSLMELNGHHNAFLSFSLLGGQTVPFIGEEAYLAGSASRKNLLPIQLPIFIETNYPLCGTSRAMRNGGSDRQHCTVEFQSGCFKADNAGSIYASDLSAFLPKFTVRL